MTTTTRGRYRKPRNHTPLAILVAAVTTVLVLIGACSTDDPDPGAARGRRAGRCRAGRLRVDD